MLRFVPSTHLQLRVGAGEEEMPESPVALVTAVLIAVCVAVLLPLQPFRNAYCAPACAAVITRVL